MNTPPPLSPSGNPGAQSSAHALASMILGICGIVLCLGPLAGIPAVIFGHMAQSRIKCSGGALTGAGMATAGLVMGYFSFAMIFVIGLMAAIAIPNFVKAPILQIVFGLWLAWLPVGGWNDGAWRNTILPITVLALPQIAVIARLTRAAMIEALRAPHIRTLRAQGLGLATIMTHALRSACLPVVSYMGPAAAALLTGSIVVETIFGIPGVGRYFIEGALNRDYTLVMGTVVLVAVFVILFNLAADIAYAILDPRVRYE